MPWSGAVKRLAYHEASALMNLTKGLSEDEVVSILGKPGGKEMKGSRARLLYPMLTSSGHKFDHEIVFNKGKLTSYGLAESWDRS